MNTRTNYESTVTMATLQWRPCNGDLAMATLTVRIPDDKHARLIELAKHRNIRINKLIEELSTMALAAFDAETRFRTKAIKRSRKRGLKPLDKLDRLGG